MARRTLIICKCGEFFGNEARFREHVALQNPRWPRSSADDKHGVMEPREFGLKITRGNAR